jgi:hypothetical protein
MEQDGDPCAKGLSVRYALACRDVTKNPGWINQSRNESIYQPGFFVTSRQAKAYRTLLTRRHQSQNPIIITRWLTTTVTIRR